MARKAYTTVDEYITDFPKEVQKLLQQVRKTITKAAPNAQECISYNIPVFKQNGAVLYFAAFKNHLSVYPAPRNEELFKEELQQYQGGKGTIQFDYDKPINLDLIKRIVIFRVAKNEEKKMKKK